jgi:hypothetical protein
MTVREHEIVTALCSKVRLFSLDQIARTWWSGRPRELRRAAARLKRLAGDGWLRSAVVLARPLLALDSPVVEWAPGTPFPDFQAISRQLRRRWTVSATKTLVFLAAPRAVATFGGSARGVVPNLCQTTHDLHVGEIYLGYLRTDRGKCDLWVGEDAIAGRFGWEKKLDAVLADDRGRVLRGIEFGGSYRPDRVQACHEECATRNIPYSLW